MARGTLRGLGRGRRERGRGQALAELALVLPIFLGMLFAIIDLGRVIWAYDAAANAAREGARFASVRGSSDLTPTATKAEIRAATIDYLVGAGSSPNVTVCYSSVDFANGNIGCSGNTDQLGAGNGRGNLVTVRITTAVPLFTGALFGVAGYTVTGSSTMLINN
jgi:Flp pilus assembly protein TadG